MRQLKDFSMPSIGAKIVADTYGTAGEKTISVKVHCEMSQRDTEALINALSSALKWLKEVPK